MLPRSLVILTLALGAGGCQKPMTEYTNPEYKFKVKFPGSPKEQTQPTPAGTTTKMFAVEDRNGVMAVAVTDMPLPADMPEMQLNMALDGARDGQIRSSGGTLKTSSAIQINGKHAGREFVASITTPKVGQVHSKVFFVKNRLYQVMVMGTDNYATSANANEFLNSFALTE